ncbi:hypothetical protein RJ639_022504 [Escallonia herrerae]|uniref:Uncharacterized protein n=1 Tax=Escallonia herrerae TaxID=1293975 RepID=A0AA88V4S0_9ASTE|nr:hypothetical protein RJ639_022504 [Escallonia herrerae]
MQTKPMSSVEFQGQEQEAVRRRQEDQEEGMEVRLSSPGEPMKVNEEEEEEEDGFKTPTSLDHKIPLIFPKVPRKPKYSIPVAKRKARRRIQLDISAEEIESFFPPAQLSLKDCGGKIKKIRKANMVKKLIWFCHPKVQQIMPEVQVNVVEEIDITLVFLWLSPKADFVNFLLLGARKGLDRIQCIHLLELERLVQVLTHDSTESLVE